MRVQLISERENYLFHIYKIACCFFCRTLIRSVSKTILHSPFALDILESEHISLIEKIDSNSFPLFKIAECENACATSDCYKLKKYIYSLQSPTDYREETQLKIINTGTIGRYLSRWDTAEMKYLKDKYSCPVVNKNQFLAAFPNSYCETILMNIWKYETKHLLNHIVLIL